MRLTCLLATNFTMHPLQITSYSLTALANLQLLLGIILTITAMVKDRRLCQRSNIMIAFLFVPDLIRTLLSNVQVVQSFTPELWDLSDIACLAVARWGLMSCLSGKLWLLVAISVHRYFLCVKMRSWIDSTKVSVIISTVTLIFSMSMVAAVVFVAKRETIFNNKVQQNDHQVVENDTVLILPSSVPLISGISTTDNGTLACANRPDIMYISGSINFAMALMVWIIPTIIQTYFYMKIYKHLKKQKQRFKSNRQVASRLHKNSRATLRTLLAACLSHSLSLVPLAVLNNLITWTLLDQMLRILFLNILLAGSISFLGLHGGYR